MIFINSVYIIALVASLLPNAFSWILVKMGIGYYDSAVIMTLLIEFLIVLIYRKKLVYESCEEKEKLSIKKVVSFIVLTQSIGYIVGFLHDGAGLKNPDIEGTILVVLYICILAPIMEELIFRGVCIGLLKGYDTLTQVSISALAFALFHMDFEKVIMAFCAGLILGEIRVRTKSMKYNILLHIMNNLVGLMIPPTTYIWGLIIPVILIFIVEKPKADFKGIIKDISPISVLTVIIFGIMATMKFIAKIS